MANNLIKTDMGHTYVPVTSWLPLQFSEDGESWGIKDPVTEKFYDIRDFEGTLFIEWYDDEAGKSCPLSHFKDSYCFETDMDQERGRLLIEVIVEEEK